MLSRLSTTLLAGFVLSCLMSTGAKSETLKAIGYDVPPLSGKSPVSEEGLRVEMLREMLKLSNTDLQWVSLPRARSNTAFENGEGPIYVGTGSSLSKEMQKKAVLVPFFLTRNVIFYKPAKQKDFKFTDHESFKKSGLKLGVTLGGSSESQAKKLDIPVDVAPTLESLFEKLDAGRTDVVSHVDLCGLLTIQQLFPDRVKEFAYVEEPAFMENENGILVNQEHPQAKDLIPKLQKALKTVHANGTWLRIMEKYYGKGKTPKKIVQYVEKYIADLK